MMHTAMVKDFCTSHALAHAVLDEITLAVHKYLPLPTHPGGVMAGHVTRVYTP
jgi:hypothetical protein